MNHRGLVAVLAVVAVAAMSTTLVSAQSSSSAQALRTPWGAPDLQGIWDFRSITPLERPEDLADQEFLAAEEAASLEQQAVNRDIELWNAPRRQTEAGGNVGAYNNFWMDRGTTTVGTRRTSLIVDPANGRLPPLTAGAERRAEAQRVYRREHPADSWEDRNLADRCMFTTGLPIVPSAYNNNAHLFQTPDYVAILVEMTHTVRIVRLDGGSGAGIPQFVGHSRGHWEDDTLVVETTGFHRLVSVRGSTPDAHLIERFRRVGPDTLEYEFTVEDADTWTRPWTAQVLLTRTDEPLYEYACHEGNYALPGILAGARAEEAAADGDRSR